MIAAAKPERLLSLDVYRGATMLFMASEIMRIAAVARYFPDVPGWQILAFHTSHVQWVGWSLWDLIQPSFMFMVGVALPWSIASRQAKGQSNGMLWAHTLWRSFLLIALGIFLRSVGRQQTNFTFEDVLTQIGLGYPFLFYLGWQKPKIQALAAAVILAGYWAAFAMYPLPRPDFDWPAVGVPPTWNHLTGFAAHWDKNSNFAAWADPLFLNLFPRDKPYVFNGGGYLTLNFIPSLATMIFGLLAGGLLRSGLTASTKVRYLLYAGIGGGLSGLLLSMSDICPMVKRIWTPSWALFAGGCSCLILAALYWRIDGKQKRAGTFPFIVVGMNSIAMYCLVHLIDKFLAESLKVHLGRNIFQLFGTPFERMAEGAAVLALLWLICLWMYRKSLFLRI